jgi:hypothetical protein
MAVVRVAAQRESRDLARFLALQPRSMRAQMAASQHPRLRTGSPVGRFGPSGGRGEAAKEHRRDNPRLHGP